MLLLLKSFNNLKNFFKGEVRGLIRLIVERKGERPLFFALGIPCLEGEEDYFKSLKEATEIPEDLRDFYHLEKIDITSFKYDRDVD